MDPFNDREKAFEAKFHVDEELAFKATARRDKLLGLWVAGHLGLTGPAADAYAQSVVGSDLTKPHHEAMVDKLLADLGKANAKVGAAELHAEMERLVDVARQQIMQEVAAGKQTVSPD
jgi:hypothetical protein